ncbi:DNA repair protein RadC [Maribacter dokdonensis]|uniref:DNA repair protein RadC n=1 Tax=Maribacter dokdonensis TaxID=320912 RepID=A0A1H4M5U4_9FLAO|nr:JAB domain-containing protein [Maribacter dokdonensis]SEB78460.1 DNA repair protein RadC [Maribacter dokdonensis]
MDSFNITKVSEISLSYRSKVAAKDRPKITSSKDAYQLLHATWDKERIELQEQFVILLLSQSNRVLGKVLLSSGTTSGTTIDLKFIIVAAAKANAQGLILSHNHPSGNTNPSRADRDLTDKIRAACQIISVTLLDHVIVTPHDGYSSFADEGWI